MGMIVKVWRAESARLMSIVLALVAVGVVPGAWGKILGAVLPLLGGQAVRQTVWAPDTVKRTVKDAATTVASQITPEVAGTAGEMTVGALGIVDGVVTAAVG